MKRHGAVPPPNLRHFWRCSHVCPRHVWQTLTKLDLSKFYFGAFAVADLAGIPCFVTRTGYTGEDGFEISVPNQGAVALTEKLMAAGGVHLSGARA